MLRQSLETASASLPLKKRGRGASSSAWEMALARRSPEGNGTWAVSWGGGRREARSLGRASRSPEGGAKQETEEGRGGAGKEGR